MNPRAKRLITPLCICLIVMGHTLAISCILLYLRETDTTSTQVRWNEVYYCSFKSGYSGDYFGWGTLKLVPDGVEVNPGRNYCGALFVTFHHRNNWAMETRLKFINSTKWAEASLLDRDGKKVTAESAIGVFLGTSSGTVRHMVNGVNRAYQMFNLPFTIKQNEWYILRFTFHNSTVECYINAILCFRRENMQNSSSGYTEPHFAVFNGTAIFEYLKIYEAI